MLHTLEKTRQIVEVQRQKNFYMSALKHLYDCNINFIIFRYVRLKSY